MLLRGFAMSEAPALLEEVSRIAQAAPFRHLVTPGGRAMSVAMTNCGRVGWVSDRSGYRYDAVDPNTGAPWPAMPPSIPGPRRTRRCYGRVRRLRPGRVPDQSVRRRSKARSASGPRREGCLGADRLRLARCARGISVGRPAAFRSLAPPSPRERRCRRLGRPCPFRVSRSRSGQMRTAPADWQRSHQSHVSKGLLRLRSTVAPISVPEAWKPSIHRCRDLRPKEQRQRFREFESRAHPVAG